MDYRDFLDHLLEGDYAHVEFHVDGYGHYRHCEIDYVPGKDQDNLFYPYVEFRLTPDGKERCVFHKKFNAAEKMFHLKGQGDLTLQDIWKRIVLERIEYANGRVETF